MKKQHVELSKSDKKYLINLLSKGRLKVRKQKRAQALLELDRGKTFIEVQNQLNVSYPTVLSWSKKYKLGGLSFLDDQPRPGRPAGLSGEDRAKITALACSEPPEGYCRWSLRLLADRLVELNICESISHNQVGVILKKMNFSLTENVNGASEK